MEKLFLLGFLGAVIATLSPCCRGTEFCPFLKETKG